MYLNPFIVPAVALMLADMVGWLRVDARRLRWWRWLGIAAASGPGLAPVLSWVVRPEMVSGVWPFGAVAGGYLLSFVIFSMGALDLSPSVRGKQLRGVGYAGLVLLAVIPSWVLVVLTPLVALAGVGLVRAGVESPAG